MQLHTYVRIQSFQTQLFKKVSPSNGFLLATDRLAAANWSLAKGVTTSSLTSLGGGVMMTSSYQVAVVGKGGFGTWKFHTNLLIYVSISWPDHFPQHLPRPHSNPKIDHRHHNEIHFHIVGPG